MGRMPLEGGGTLKRWELGRGKSQQVAHVPGSAVGARTSGGSLRSLLTQELWRSRILWRGTEAYERDTRTLEFWCKPFRGKPQEPTKGCRGSGEPIRPLLDSVVAERYVTPREDAHRW